MFTSTKYQTGMTARHVTIVEYDVCNVQGSYTCHAHGKKYDICPTDLHRFYRCNNHWRKKNANPICCKNKQHWWSKITFLTWDRPVWERTEVPSFQIGYISHHAYITILLLHSKSKFSNKVIPIEIIAIIMSWLSIKKPIKMYNLMGG